MRRAVLLLLVLVLTGCAGLGRRRHTRERLDALAAEAAAGKHVSVIAALSGETISELPRFARPRAYLLFGQSLRAAGEPGRALQVFQLAEGLYPKNLNLLTELATVLHRTGLEGRALPYYRRILKIHPNNAISNNGIAEIYRSQGNLAKAQAHYERALSEVGWDRHAAIWRNYGGVLAERRFFDKAAEALERSLSLEETVEGLLSLARVERARGRTRESRERLAAAILRNPEREDALLQRGLWELEEHDLDAAFTTAQLILSAREDHALGRWLRASVYLRRGEKEQASADLAVAAIDSQENPFVAKTARAMLERLMGNP